MIKRNLIYFLYEKYMNLVTSLGSEEVCSVRMWHPSGLCACAAQALVERVGTSWATRICVFFRTVYVFLQNYWNLF